MNPDRSGIKSASPGHSIATPPLPDARSISPLRVPTRRTPTLGSNETVVHLNIRRLTVEGMSHRNQARMMQAMERELGRLVQSSPVLDWPAVSRLKGIDTSKFPAGATAEEIGRHVASAIFRGLKR